MRFCIFTLKYCFLLPDGLQVASEHKEDSYHFLVFTDLFGNRTHGVVVQYYRGIQVKTHPKGKHVEANNFRLFFSSSHWFFAFSVLSGRCCPKRPSVEFIEISSLCSLFCVRHFQVPLLQCPERLSVMVISCFKSTDSDAFNAFYTFFFLRNFCPSTSQSVGPVANSKTR